jgi:hypothetical protein
VLLPALVEASDFVVPASYPVYGIYCGDVLAGLRGAGVDATEVRVRRQSSTRASLVPLAEADRENVNPLYVMRVDGRLSTEVSGFTVRGTPQGHLYNGLSVYRGSRIDAHDFRVAGIPGDAPVNPGETFSLNVFRHTDGRFRWFEVDGTDEGGVPVAASGIGINFGGRLVFEDFHVHGTAYGSGVAAYETADLTFLRGRTEDCAYHGLNFENVSGEVRIDRHTFRRCAPELLAADERGVHVGIATNTGSATYVISDPDFDGPRLRVRVTGYKGGARTQVVGDVHLVVDGRERPDLLELIVR